MVDMDVVVCLALFFLICMVFVHETRIAALKREIETLYAILEEAKIIKKR